MIPATENIKGLAAKASRCESACYCRLSAKELHTIDGLCSLAQDRLNINTNAGHFAFSIHSSGTVVEMR